jgi:competence protein ComEC
MSRVVVALAALSLLLACTPAGEVGGPPARAPTAVEGLTVHFLDVGQGDATLLVAPDATVLVDTGRHNARDVVAHLERLGVTAIDVLVVTHPHADHLGQFDRVLGAVDVAEAWWSGNTHTTATFDRALAALESSDAAYAEPLAGDVTTVGSLGIEIVHPEKPSGHLDDDSLSLRVTYGAVRLLFTGDAGTTAEAAMVARDPALLAAEVLQVGHHGSAGSTSAPFLAAVAPAVAVYSAGRDNPYGHPHDVVLERLRAADVRVYGTDVHGTVTLVTDGRQWTVTTARPGEPVA